MVFYIASQTYQEIISRTVKESGRILAGGECSNELYLLKYIKENIRKLSELDSLIVDLAALHDTDEEIINALDMIRLMYDEIRIIILAANRLQGDELLSKCFQMSIYNLINTDDFVVIKNELLLCITEGKKYKDAVIYKDNKQQEKVIIKNEIKQTVNKVLIGMAGTQERIGTTHNCIVMANYLRKRGYMVAIAEMNPSKCLDTVLMAFEEKLFEDSYFSLSGVDYYPETNADKLGSILGKSYNFILADFGNINAPKCDRVTFNKADVRIIIAGSKPWEIDYINEIFSISDKETLKQYHYCFNFTVDKNKDAIREGMAELDQIYFLSYQEDPFTTADFPAAEIILEQYMPIKLNETKRKGIFKRKRT